MGCWALKPSCLLLLVSKAMKKENSGESNTHGSLTATKYSQNRSPSNDEQQWDLYTVLTAHVVFVLDTESSGDGKGVVTHGGCRG